MATERTPDLRLFFDILLTLDRIGAPIRHISGHARRMRTRGIAMTESFAE